MARREAQRRREHSTVDPGRGVSEVQMPLTDLTRIDDRSLHRTRVRRTITTAAFTTMLAAGILLLIAGITTPIVYAGIALTVAGALNAAISAGGLWRTRAEQRSRIAEHAARQAADAARATRSTPPWPDDER